MPSIYDEPEVQAALAGRTSKRGKHVPGQPKLTESDRSLAREFDRWLRRQPEIAAPSPEDETGMFTELLTFARRNGLRLRTPAGVESLVTLFLDDDADDQNDETDGAVAAAIATLHDYVHFRAETDTDPSVWEEIHDLFDEPMPGADILRAAIEDNQQLDPDERWAALTGTRLVANVPELLTWIGRGRNVAPSGGVKRADITHAAGLLGIAAVGVNKLPPGRP